MKHIPNILSGMRILLIPFFVWQMLWGSLVTAGLLLAVSGLTDLLDGFLARRFGWVSDLGKVLDPAADKLTQAAACICLLIHLRRFWPFFVALLVKDLVMLVLGGRLLHKGVHLEGARWFGKVSTFVFYGVMILLVLAPGLPGWLVALLLSLATGCALVSGLLYIPEYRRYRKEAAQGNITSKGELGHS